MPDRQILGMPSCACVVRTMRKLIRLPPWVSSLATFHTHRHFGPSVPDLPAPAPTGDSCSGTPGAAPAPEAKPCSGTPHAAPAKPKSGSDNHKNQRKLIEFCRSPTGVLCILRSAGTGTCPALLAEEEDAMTTEGSQYAKSFVEMPDAGYTLLFGALSCTWGSSWQSMRWRKRGQDPNYVGHMAGLYRQFELLLANFVALARAVIAKEGFVAFEWPAYSRLCY